jgi:multisubunit Na+/H+ antiporter MnhG subunit
MLNPFRHLETNLARAGLALTLAILGSLATGLFLIEWGVHPDAAPLVVFLAMPFVAWLMSRAAAAKGKSPVLFGLASLLPPLAIILFATLLRAERQGDRGHEA